MRQGGQKRTIEDVLIGNGFHGKPLRLAYSRLFCVRAWRNVQQCFGLTDKQTQIGLMLCKGESLREISKKLDLTYATGKQYFKQLRGRMRVQTQAQAIVKMILASGAITPDVEVSVEEDARLLDQEEHINTIYEQQGELQCTND